MQSSLTARIRKPPGARQNHSLEDTNSAEVRELGRLSACSIFMADPSSRTTGGLLREGSCRETSSTELVLDSSGMGGHEDMKLYDHLETMRTELDLVKCSEDIENDLLEASLDEDQCVVR